MDSMASSLSFVYSIWQNEACMILANRSISDCTNEPPNHHWNNEQTLMI